MSKYPKPPSGIVNRQRENKLIKKWAKCGEICLQEENFMQLRRGNKRTPTENIGKFDLIILHNP